MSQDRDIWERLHLRELQGLPANELLGRYKGDELRRLLEWPSSIPSGAILKTDLHEEAAGPDQILLDGPKFEAPVYAIDISEGIARTALKRAHRMNMPSPYFLVADIRATPFKAHSFAMVVSNSTLDHLSPQEVPEALAEIKRILDPGGTLVLTMNNFYNIFFLCSVKLGRFLRQIPYPSYFYTPRELERLLIKIGFVVDSMSTTTHLPTPFYDILPRLNLAVGKVASDYLAKVAVRMARTLSRLPTRSLTGWFIAARCHRP